jgi:hypothetical protein
MLSSAIGLLGGLGGDKTPDKGTDLGSPKYNDKMPSMDGSGMTEGTQSYLDDKFGTPGSAAFSAPKPQDETPDEYYFKDDELL